MSSKIAEDNQKAREMGLTYGKYKALLYDPEKSKPKTPAESVRRKQKRKYSYHAAFALWQEGKNDMEIAKALGVSRALIQRWRDTLELPSTTKETVDTKKYRLAHLQDGTEVVLKDEDL